MPNTLLVDTGPLVALFDKDDSHHRAVVDFLERKGPKSTKEATAPLRFVTTTAVLTEVTHLLDFRVEAQIDFLEWTLRSGMAIEEVKVTDLVRIIELTRKYADRPMDFADASLVIAAERTGIRKILSLDADFDVYRLPGKMKIQNVFR